jgi:hypothetical protein
LDFPLFGGETGHNGSSPSPKQVWDKKLGRILFINEKSGGKINVQYSLRLIVYLDIAL